MSRVKGTALQIRTGLQLSMIYRNCNTGTCVDFLEGWERNGWACGDLWEDERKRMSCKYRQITWGFSIKSRKNMTICDRYACFIRCSPPFNFFMYF